MTSATLLSPVTGSGQSPNDALRPALVDDYPFVSMSDVTEPEDAPQVRIRVVCEEAILAAIRADERYGDASVLAEETL